MYKLVKTEKKCKIYKNLTKKLAYYVVSIKIHEL